MAADNMPSGKEAMEFSARFKTDGTTPLQDTGHRTNDDILQCRGFQQPCLNLFRGAPGDRKHHGSEWSG